MPAPWQASARPALRFSIAASSRAIASYVKEAGGYLEADDLAAFKPEWVQPISVSYRGYDVWEIPPNGQGLVTLMALNMMKGFDTQSKDSVIDYHRQIEAMKLALPMDSAILRTAAI